ncbi:MAG TPA: hypothetical protein VEF53_07895 [Patescibacteria group bacterium]|nr:hypothetical protein [Patescibacteria group bacterium]
MILINCTDNCLYQENGMCTLDNVSSLSNTTNKGCEFYKERISKVKEDNDD